MNIYFALGLCFLPFVLSFAGFKIFSKTGFGLLLIASLLGLVAVLPITFLQFYFSFLIPTGALETQKDVARLFIKVLIFNGLIEELLKTLLIAFIRKVASYAAAVILVSVFFAVVAKIIPSIDPFNFKPAGSDKGLLFNILMIEYKLTFVKAPAYFNMIGKLLGSVERIALA